MFLAAPLQGLLPIFAQSVLKGGPGLFGLMLSAIGLGSILGAFLLSCIPSFYPRHHLIPLAMCVFAGIGLLFSLSTAPALSLIILVASGCFWCSVPRSFRELSPIDFRMDRGGVRRCWVVVSSS
jgi:predicted MFS family arabinose efflux permease